MGGYEEKWGDFLVINAFSIPIVYLFSQEVGHGSWLFQAVLNGNGYSSYTVEYVQGGTAIDVTTLHLLQSLIISHPCLDVTLYLGIPCLLS